MSRTRIHPDDAPDLLTETAGDADYEAIGTTATHSADTTAVHGIADTSALSLTSHDHDAEYEATGAVAAHEADTTNVHAHTSLASVGVDDHHARDHAINAAVHTGTLDDAQIPAGITRDAEAAAAYADIAHSHGGAAWTLIVKPADTGRTNNTVSADPDLVVTLLANTNYVLYLQVFMLTNATADARYQLTFSGTTTRVRRQILRTATGDVAAHITVGTAFDGAPVVLSTTGLNPFVQERIILQVGASGGSFAFQWAQVTTNPGACTVLEGSYLEYAVT